jgi:hypothetical protein
MARAAETTDVAIRVLIGFITLCSSKLVSVKNMYTVVGED